ncbi:MAG: glutathione S-transferase family protein [Sphingomicrobium sp.]|nr:glutathione S-transferase family protein [Sphingomonadales bacterium]
MAELIFYTNPQSRGQIVRWMLEEVGAPYETHILDYATTLKQEPYLSLNPMGKIPAIQHRGKVITEVAAICLYLADAFPEAGLAPAVDDRANYYRWTFFTSGPIEAAFSNKAVGWEPAPDKQRMFGYGNYDLAIDTWEKAVSGKTYLAGDRFSACDLFVASQMGFMLAFNMLDPRPAFIDYVARMTDRDAYRRAKQIDEEAAAQMNGAA